MITLASQRYTIAAYGGTLDSRYPLGFDPSPYDYFIGPNGSDDNDGLTTDSPWAITALSGKGATIAGKTVGLLDGTYNVTHYTTDFWGGNTRYIGIKIPATSAGASEAPTVIQAVNARQAILTDAGSTTVLFLVDETASHVQVKNLRFSPRNGLKVPLNWWGNDGRVEGCQFDAWWSGQTNGDNTGAIYGKAKDSARIERLVVSNCKFLGVYNTGATSYSANSAAVMGFSYSDLVIEFCTATNCYALFKPKYDWAGYTVRYNHVYGVGGFFDNVCTPTDYVGRPALHNNLVIAPFGGGADAYQNGAGEQFPDIDVYNNTLVMPGDSNGIGFRWYDWQEYRPTATAKFWNNIIHLTSPASGTFSFHVFGGFTGVTYDDQFSLMDYNCYPALNSSYFYATQGDRYSPDTTWTTWAAYKAATGLEAGGIQSDPGFTVGTGTTPANYQLSGGSACKSAGKSNGTSGGVAVDIGCWGGVSAPSQIGVNW